MAEALSHAPNPELPINLLNINLVGLQAHGLEYLPG